MKSNKLIFLCLSLSGLLLTACKPSAPVDNAKYYHAEYQNPLEVLTPDGKQLQTEVADPSIVKGDDGLYYIFATDRMTLVSEDCCTWNQIDYEIINWPTWQNDLFPKTQFYMWAPDVIKVKDKWIYYYSLGSSEGKPGIGYGISDTCAGPYVDQGPLFTYEEIGDKDGTIDPQVFYDADGSLHMVYGSFNGIFVLDLEDDGMALKEGEDGKGNKTIIAGYSAKSDFTTYEGAYMIYKDGYYYLFVSSNLSVEHENSLYAVYTGRSKSLEGPFVGEDKRPLTLSGNGNTYGSLVLHSKPSFREFVAGPGHNSILIDDKGDYWIYYHAYHKNDNFKKRHLFMDKLTWDNQGFPLVKDQNPSFEETLEGPALKEE